ncbi:MAG: DUF3991 and TOPRIM domain-containing protein [Clostridia bacterium]|nr:DUF3991 and TOPRIM domain-containing protein [Clostridia bacterium]
MKYYSKEEIVKAKEIDLLTYLQNYDPNELIHTSRENYTTKTHDSLKISNGMWYWFSRGIGGKTALEYLIQVKELSFIQAVEMILGESKKSPPSLHEIKEKEKIDRLILPKKSVQYNKTKEYLTSRGIDEDIIQECIDNDLIYEQYPNKNVIFIGYDESKNPRYACCRATNSSKYVNEASGSDKKFSFRLLSKEVKNTVHLFESAIDLLSYATLLKEKGLKWYEENLISLAGVYQSANNILNSKIPKAIDYFLENNLQIEKIYIHFDNDIVGRKATKTLELLLKNKYEIIDIQVPFGKDVNDFLCFKKGINIKKQNKSYEK